MDFMKAILAQLEKLFSRKEEHAEKSTHHQRMAEHDEALAEHHAAIAKCEKADGNEEKSKLHDKISKVHSAKVAEHTSQSELYETKKAEVGGDLTKVFQGLEGGDFQTMLNKAVAEALGNQLQPMNVSGVTPTKPGVTAVPRAGQKPVPLHAASVLEKITAVEDGSDVSLTGAREL
jgi:hypothetical protein